MAGSISNYLENKWLGHVLKTSAYTQPSTLYLALSTADPLDDGSGIAEPSGNNYARAACTSSFAAAATRAVTTDVDITFNQASGSWGTITHWAIFDDVSAGNMLAHGDFTTSKVVSAGVTPKVTSGNLTVSVVAGAMSTYLAHKLLDHTFLTAAYSVPTNLYVGLSTANPTDDFSTLAEPASGAYARVNVNAWTVSASAAENTNIITFPTATGSWGTISHHFLTEDASGGTSPLYYGQLDSSQAITTDDIVNYVAGALDITQQ